MASATEFRTPSGIKTGDTSSEPGTDVQGGTSGEAKAQVNEENRGESFHHGTCMTTEIPPSQGNRGGDVPITASHVDSEVVCQTQGGTVDSVSSHSLQQNNQEAEIKTEFSSMAAFPWHREHGVIPHNSRPMVKKMFAFWIVDTVQWSLNVFASLAYFVVDRNGGVTFALSFLWLLLFSLLSLFSYYMYYTSKRMEKNDRFNVTVIIMLFLILINAVAALGITNFSAGFIIGLAVFGRSVGAGVTILLVGFYFGLWTIGRICAVIVVIISKCQETSNPYQQEIQA